MSKIRNLIFIRHFRVFAIASALSVFLIGLSFSGGEHSSAQTVGVSAQSTTFRVGERLSYNVSFGKIAEAAYAETYVVSRGKISGKDAVEIRSKVKTLDLISAAFYVLDEARTVYAAPDTGLPLYLNVNSHDSAIPKETVNNFLGQPTSNFDLLTLLFKARESGGIGTFLFFEDEKTYNANFQLTKPEKVKTEAGEFDTTVSLVQSEFLTANGIKDFKINFTSDEFRIPVLIRFKTAKGEFRAAVSNITVPEPDVATPTPTPSATRAPVATPKPTATPDPYVENRPLAEELGFQLGEVLEYQISAAGKPLALISLNAKERKRFQKEDSLLLTATITSVVPESNIFRLGDGASVQVDPETLAPTLLQSKFDSVLPGLSQDITYNKKTGGITVGTGKAVDAPIGTHTLLSLVYAMRSFNLKRSKDLSNPVNDTRVAVFWETRPYIFVLRPTNPSEITINGEKISAQLITITTRDKALDALNLSVWLNAETRVPVRFTFGPYKADLIQQSSNLPK